MAVLKLSWMFRPNLIQPDKLFSHLIYRMNENIIVVTQFEDSGAFCESECHDVLKINLKIC